MEKYEVKVDGEKVGVERKNERIWNENAIELTCSARVKKHILNDKVAFTKGPIVLARDVRFGDITKPVAAKSGLVRAKRIKNDKFKNNVTYEISIGSEKFAACDYSSAGKNYDDESSCITVWQNIKP